MTKKRITLYVDEDVVAFAEELKEQIEERFSFFPSLSQSAWYAMIFGSGLSFLVEQTTTVIEQN